MAAATGRFVTTQSRRVEQVVPAAARTIASLRDIGYELPQAVADLVDNSVSAGASIVRVDLHFDGTDSWIRIADDGRGMDTATRYGSRCDMAVCGTDDGERPQKSALGCSRPRPCKCRRVVVARVARWSGRASRSSA